MALFRSIETITNYCNVLGMRSLRYGSHNLILSLCLVFVLPLFLECRAFSGHSSPPSQNFVDPQQEIGGRLDSCRRRKMIFLSGLSLIVPPVPLIAAAPPMSRDIDVGGGFDLLGEARLKERDVIYPISMEGPWIVNRIITLVEGDSFQAESAWKALGGKDLKPNMLEQYPTRFIQSSTVGGDTPYVVTDRGYEMSARIQQKSPVSWNVEKPDILEYDKIQIVVVKRSIEPPSDEGFGYDELYRIDDGFVIRAVQVKRRFRRAFDSTGNRIVEGLEIMKTFRVLDGIAGTELPTSTTKSQLRLTRT